MQHESRQALLFLNGYPVGVVKAETSVGSWGFGEFNPSPEFERFAALFGGWSILIHEDPDHRVSRAALEEMRAAECAIDALRAELLWLDTRQRSRLRTINIDGSLMEWKLDPLAPCAS